MSSKINLFMSRFQRRTLHVNTFCLKVNWSKKSFLTPQLQLAASPLGSSRNSSVTSTWEGVEKAPLMGYWGATQHTLLKQRGFKSKSALNPDSFLLPSRIRLLKGPITLSNEHNQWRFTVLFPQNSLLSTCSSLGIIKPGKSVRIPWRNILNTQFENSSLKLYILKCRPLICLRRCIEVLELTKRYVVSTNFLPRILL